MAAIDCGRYLTAASRAGREKRQRRHSGDFGAPADRQALPGGELDPDYLRPLNRSNTRTIDRTGGTILSLLGSTVEGKPEKLQIHVARDPEIPRGGHAVAHDFDAIIF